MSMPPPDNPYRPPTKGFQPMSSGAEWSQPPPVHFWYRVYCGFMVVLYMLVAGLGGFLLWISLGGDEMLGGPGAIAPDDQMEELILGIVYLLLGLIFAVAFAVGMFYNRGNFGWVYGIIMIAIGMTSCCTLPATIPLLISWLKDENKSWIIG